MNIVLLTGNLVRDPESTVTGTGTSVTKFTIAVNRNFGKKTEGGQDADFIRITCFDKRAEFAEKYLTKGRKVGVEARVQTGSYQSKDGNTVYTTDFVANNIEFLDSKRDTESTGGGTFQPRPEPLFDTAPKAQDNDTTTTPGGFALIDENDGDVPF